MSEEQNPATVHDPAVDVAEFTLGTHPQGGASLYLHGGDWDQMQVPHSLRAPQDELDLARFEDEGGNAWE